MPPVEVLATTESVEEVRRRLEHADITDPRECALLAHEIELLEHWASLLKDSDYAAMGEGLAHFARRCAHWLARAAEHCRTPG
ncbi:hypothetical protein [Saccharopolyspora phatthalungensis]|uniref:Uncharacterized protein n=1 Tax=Saccharopolyspora phatthalungensis TaxID=664693 RepID=A0A840QF08_9PSEU|nr:hypothetical protein [Saccharopolyspora phatthalungensis]MBB5158621.1 hypothetical protein [Saccharopolyspora phatthalungensis]